MDDRTTPLRRPQVGRAALWLAIGSIVLYFLALTALNNHPIADEKHHLRGLRWFCDGNWRLPGFLPMLPGYHVLASLPARLFGPSLFVARAFTVLMGIAATLLVYQILKRTNQPHPADALLHFAWNPLLFPFMALAYTDLPALLCLVAAVYLHVRRQFALSALPLLVACLIRQSNVVWVAFMGAWAVIELWEQRVGNAPSEEVPGLGRLVRGAAPRIWPHIALGVLAVGFFIGRGGVTAGRVSFNQPAVNPAQFYLFALFVVVLWAPLWLTHVRTEWRTLYQAAVTRPLFCALAAAAILALVFNFRNLHPWNQGLSHLRNWPLVGMSSSLTLRVLLVLCIAAVAPLVVRFTWSQPRRRVLAVVWLFSFLFLLPQALADPRYYIIPVFFLNLFARYGAFQARRLTIWYGLISAAAATVACIWGHPTGGLW